MLAQMQTKAFAITAAIVLILAIGIGHATAKGRIDISPRRIVMEPRDRNSEFTLINMSDEEGTFRVKVVYYKQDENGTYSKLDAPLNPAFDAEQIIRLSPRQFTLPADGRQKVRFSIRKPADLPDGEYRFHLLATRMSEYGPPTPVDEGEKVVGMNMNISTAIPVIVRHGNVSVTTTLSDASYVAANNEGKPEVKVTINREGNISTVGVMRAYWTPAGGSTVEIGHVTNMNVFPEISKRFATIPLEAPLQGSGSLQIVYMNEQTMDAYAETTLQH